VSDIDISAATVTDLNEPYWASLRQGNLSFQRCTRDGHAWLPARNECPECLYPEWTWERASGRGRLISWVVYHYAANPSLALKLPYNVAIVELAEGPRLATRLLELPEDLTIDCAVELAVSQDGTLALPTFRVVQS
jgi:uncharacterized OB-fold protein